MSDEKIETNGEEIVGRVSRPAVVKDSWLIAHVRKIKIGKGRWAIGDGIDLKRCSARSVRCRA